MELVSPYLQAALAVASVVSCAFAAWTLTRSVRLWRRSFVTKTSSTSTYRLEPNNVLLDVLAISSPELKDFLARHPNAVYLTVTHPHEDHVTYQLEFVTNGQRAAVPLDTIKHRELGRLDALFHSGSRNGLRRQGVVSGS